MDACDTLARLGHAAEADGRTVHRTVLPARPARHGEPAVPLSEGVAGLLAARGIDRLWSHQAEALDHLRAGRDVVLATGTASGKSLCYQIPILEAALARRPATALAVFPTKALAQDQLRSLHAWPIPGLHAYTYDGDTPVEARAQIRRHANVLLTNPEMLHVGILPAHRRWATFLKRLELVVVDELHTLRGTFGSHVAHVLRRLRRLCAHVGSDPTLCFASATIGAPDQLATRLAGRAVVAVTDDGAPAPERHLACWQRPVVDPEDGRRASATTETATLLEGFVRAGHPTIAFTRSRRGAELVAQQTRAALGVGRLADAVAAYRAGYLPRERRQLEADLAEGRLLGVAATSALELGIDVGGLDAVVVNGFPGTLASLRQQTGRAGRAGRRAAAVLVAGDDQLDQWYAAHPEELVARPPEPAVVNPDNPSVLRDQVACAAHELPVTPADVQWFGPGLDDAVRELVLDDRCRLRDGAAHWSGRGSPAAGIGLRSSGTGEFHLVDEHGDPIGTVDDARVFEVAHGGAIYLHQGRQFRVERLDPDERLVHLVAADDLDEHTQARTETTLHVTAEDRSDSLGAATVHLGAVEVVQHVVGYQRRRTSTGAVIETVALDLPPRVLVTRACWYTMPWSTLLTSGIDASRIPGTVHAAEHALIGLLPLFTICDRWDVGGVSTADHPQTGMPTVFVYDGAPGGAGIAELAYAAAADHVAATRDLVNRCGCDDGCPSCVQSPKCGNFNEVLDKAGARRWLELVARP